jgi:hypothetical protein
LRARHRARNGASACERLTRILRMNKTKRKNGGPPRPGAFRIIGIWGARGRCSASATAHTQSQQEAPAVYHLIDPPGLRALQTTVQSTVAGSVGLYTALPLEQIRSTAPVRYRTVPTYYTLSLYATKTRTILFLPSTADRHSGSRPFSWSFCTDMGRPNGDAASGARTGATRARGRGGVTLPNHPWD